MLARARFLTLAAAVAIYASLLLLAAPSRADDATPADPADDYRIPALSDEERKEVEGGEPWVRVESFPGSDVKTGHVVAVVPFTVDQVRAVVEDLPRFKEFIPDLLESTLLERDTGEGWMMRSGLDLPWPVDNRLWTVRVRIFWAQVDGVKVRVQRWSHVPGTGNIKSTRGRWVMRPYERDPQKTIVSYFVHTDPGGWIPDFLINFATKVYLPDLIPVLEKRVKDVAEGRVAPPQPLAQYPFPSGG